MSPVVRMALWGLALGAAFWAGSKQGEADRGTPVEPARVVAVVAVDAPVAPVAPASKSPPIRDVSLPEDLSTLAGSEFLAAMPTLERLARGGRADALRVLFDHLDACANHTPVPEERIRAMVDERFMRELPMEGIDAATCEQRRSAGHECRAGDLREMRLHAAMSRQHECAALSAEQVGARIAWARLAVDRGDRGMVIALRGANALRNMPRAERMRHLDALVALADRSREEMDRLIHAGDLDALERARAGYASGSSLVDQDSVAAHVADLVLRRVESDGVHGSSPRYGLEGRLTPEQLAEADARAEALYARCCAR